MVFSHVFWVKVFKPNTMTARASFKLYCQFWFQFFIQWISSDCTTFWLWTERTKQQKRIEVVVKSMLLLLQISMHICLVLFSQKGLIILVSVFCIGFCILDGTKKLMLGFGWLQLLLLVEDDLGCFEVVEILHFLLKQLLTWLDSSLFYWYVMNLIKMHSWSQQISLGINHCSFIF